MLNWFPSHHFAILLSHHFAILLSRYFAISQFILTDLVALIIIVSDVKNTLF